jgi:hypothetical protein
MMQRRTYDLGCQQPIGVPESHHRSGIERLFDSAKPLVLPLVCR